eukprot:5051688-Prymnesium_polylepis.1
MTRKEEKDAELLAQIKGSAVRQGKSLLYSDTEKVLGALAKVDSTYSKWLIILSDLVDLENKVIRAWLELTPTTPSPPLAAAAPPAMPRSLTRTSLPSASTDGGRRDGR